MTESKGDALAAWDEAIDAEGRVVPASAALLLGHGAGGDHRAPLLAQLAHSLARRGVAVGRFDFDYRAAGKKLPDPMPRLEARYERALADVAARAPGVPLFVGGKSMGGRVATHLAARGVACAGVVLLGYPLHPAGKKDRLRDAHLPAVTAPMLFVQGTRDDLCDLALLAPVLARCGDRALLHVVADGDHSLEVRRSSGRTKEQALAEIVDVVAAFLRGAGEASRTRT
jgi:predicted alpha/beta-hydrolase family hydrolase